MAGCIVSLSRRGFGCEGNERTRTHTTDMVEEAKTIPQQPEVLTGELPVYYVKSNFYRVIHVDGVYGGGAPSVGNIMMTVFNHKIPLPERSVNDAQGREIREKRVTRYGLENEAEASLVMDLNTAKVLHQWLDNTIRATEALVQNIQQSKSQK
jgi:hypothetical protein